MLRSALRVFLASVVCACSLGLASADDETALRSRAETSDYEETSRLADVESFLAELGRRSELLRVIRFGTTGEGRPLLLATLSNPPVAQPRDLASLGRPVVLVQANIHGGEVEGKEASLHLLRRLALGDLRPILDRVVVLVIPNYNADGNEAISLENRTAQYGPIGGVGRRENAAGLDLNRDYMKLDSPEARAFVGLLNTWDPHVVVDLHTTNGSHHGYHLTYSIPVNLSFDETLLRYHRETLMPALADAMSKRHAYRTYYYGNFDGRPPAEGQPDTRSWVAFDHRPRIGQNYVGLRNRIAILSEAYSYLDFRSRIAVTEAFVAEILGYAAAHGEEIRSVVASAERRWSERALGEEPIPLGVEYVAKALPTKVPILVGSVTTETNPRNGKPMTVARTDEFRAVEMPDYGYFESTRSVPIARAYALPAVPGSRATVELLLRHGVAVERLTAPLECEVVEVVPDEVRRSPRAFQNRHELDVRGTARSDSRTLPAGTLLVRTAQPLGRLAAYLLDPESDDGIVHWNLLDPQPEAGRALPVLRLMRPIRPATELVTAVP